MNQEIDTVAGDPFLKIEFKSTLSSKEIGLRENALFCLNMDHLFEEAFRIFYFQWCLVRKCMALRKGAELLVLVTLK